MTICFKSLFIWLLTFWKWISIKILNFFSLLTQKSNFLKYQSSWKFNEVCNSLIWFQIIDANFFNLMLMSAEKSKHKQFKIFGLFKNHSKLQFNILYFCELILCQIITERLNFTKKTTVNLKFSTFVSFFLNHDKI